MAYSDRSSPDPDLGPDRSLAQPRSEIVLLFAESSFYKTPTRLAFEARLATFFGHCDHSLAAVVATFGKFVRRKLVHNSFQVILPVDDVVFGHRYLSENDVQGIGIQLGGLMGKGMDVYVTP